MSLLPDATARAPLAVAVVVLATLAACQPAPEQASSPPEEGWTLDVGFLEFPTSGSEEAQRHFLRGVSILHSFGYKQAIAEFQRAQELDPGFAMAYWGEALCYNHPLLPERDLESPRAVLARLGESPEARTARAATPREKDFVAAVEVLFGEGSTAERRIGYMEAMRRMHETYSEDDEVAAFYALSLLAAVGPLGDDSFRLSTEAGAIALDLFARNPDHPGAAHYIIHAFDDPVHAPLALPAADRFAEIAAAVSHARHMPSHIFIQRGMWERVTDSNDSAFQAAIDLWQPGDSVNDAVHSLDWGHYGDLQRGDWERAAERRRELDELISKSESAERAVATAPLLWAREVIETESWETRPVTDETGLEVALASGLAAVKLGDRELARAAEQRLATLSSQDVSDRSTFQRGAGPAQVAHRELAASIALAAQQTERALALLEEGVTIAESQGPPRGPASPVKPIHELFGEVLLELGRAQEASERFEGSLLQTPNRSRSLLGLARSRAASGDREGARDAYAKLAENWRGREAIEGYREAIAFLEAGS
jgi:tetratricopeptide (TPR) repeat protein